MKLSAARPETKPPAALVVGRDDQGAGWPDDGLPRFYVQVTNGFRIDPAATNMAISLRRPVPFTSAILDRAYAHKIVREFIPIPGGTMGARGSAGCHLQAVLLCAELNEADAAGLMDEEVAAPDRTGSSTRSGGFPEAHGESGAAA